MEEKEKEIKEDVRRTPEDTMLDCEICRVAVLAEGSMFVKSLPSLST